MEHIYKTPSMLANDESDLCGGCGIGIVIRIIAELIEEMELDDVSILPLGVPCPENALGWGEFTIAAPPFASSAMSASIKRLNPEQILIIFQGEGATASSGISDTIHTANRGDSLTVISINNLCKNNYDGGMSFSNTYSFNSMNFQQPINSGNLKTPEMIAALPKSQYVARVSVHNPKEIIKAKAAIKQGLINQIDDKGYSFIEIICPCHVNLDIDAVEISGYVENNIIKDYPLGIIKSV